MPEHPLPRYSVSSTREREDGLGLTRVKSSIDTTNGDWVPPTLNLDRGTFCWKWKKVKQRLLHIAVSMSLRQPSQPDGLTIVSFGISSEFAGAAIT